MSGSAAGRGSKHVQAAPYSELVDVPEGIVYIPALKSVNDEARVKLALFFRSPFDAKKMGGLFGDAVICGPFLWSRVKGKPAMRLVEGETIGFTLPQGLGEGYPVSSLVDGMIISGRGGIEIFLGVLFDALVMKKMSTIRKLSASEIKMYWTIVPYIIREPVFIVENGGARLLVDFTQDLEVGFIEDMGAIDP